jgi:hypothetical protein
VVDVHEYRSSPVSMSTAGRQSKTLMFVLSSPAKTKHAALRVAQPTSSETHRPRLGFHAQYVA